jgi:hypothetical protein
MGLSSLWRWTRVQPDLLRIVHRRPYLASGPDDELSVAAVPQHKARVFKKTLLLN